VFLVRLELDGTLIKRKRRKRLFGFKKRRKSE
jgi:hypothetical protein